MNIKKIISTLIISIILFGINTNTSYSQVYSESFYYGNDFEQTSNNEEKTDLAKIIKNDTINTKDTTLLYQIRQYFRLTGTETYDQDKPAVAYINMIMNMALGLTSLISLILVIFAFYLMFFKKEEEGFTKAKKIIIGVAIALVVIGLSWLIVNFFFDIYTTQATKNI